MLAATHSSSPFLKARVIRSFSQNIEVLSNEKEGNVDVTQYALIKDD